MDTKTEMHDEHLRHHEDDMGKSHLGNAVEHLRKQVGSLEFGHYSTAGEPMPVEKPDSPGV